MGIRLIASDLDGTLFTDEKAISDETRRTLEEVTEKGILFVPCTGRHLLPFRSWCRRFLAFSI